MTNRRVCCRLKILLADIASGRRPFDVERLSNLIHRRVLDALNNVTITLRLFTCSWLCGPGHCSYLVTKFNEVGGENVCELGRGVAADEGWRSHCGECLMGSECLRREIMGELWRGEVADGGGRSHCCECLMGSDYG